MPSRELSRQMHANARPQPISRSGRRGTSVADARLMLARSGVAAAPPMDGALPRRLDQMLMVARDPYASTAQLRAVVLSMKESLTVEVISRPWILPTSIQVLIARKTPFSHGLVELATLPTLAEPAYRALVHRVRRERRVGNSASLSNLVHGLLQSRHLHPEHAFGWFYRTREWSWLQVDIPSDMLLDALERIAPWHPPIVFTRLFESPTPFLRNAALLRILPMCADVPAPAEPVDRSSPSE